MLSRKIDIRIHDTNISLWQDDARDATFRADVYGRMKRFLRKRGWSVIEDPIVAKQHACLRHDHRICAKGDLRATLEFCGRTVEFKVWTETWTQINRHGHRYDFDKRAKLRFLDRIRLDIEFKKLVEWASRHWAVTLNDRNRGAKASIDDLTALDYIERQWLASGHCDKTLGRTVPSSNRDRTSADGQIIENGQQVWFRDRKGRVRRGTAFFALNSNFYIVTGRHCVEHASSGEILAAPPINMRAKDNVHARRSRLEGELAKAIHMMQFARAATLRNICFGDAELFLIHSNYHHAFYRANFRGYTESRTEAGKYTHEEATRETARVPDRLEARTLDNQHIDLGATKKAHALAA